MLLRYYLKDGKRIYTMSMTNPDGGFTLNAHPARFSPDDKFSNERILLKRRFNLLPSENKEKMA